MNNADFEYKLSGFISYEEIIRRFEFVVYHDFYICNGIASYWILREEASKPFQTIPTLYRYVFTRNNHTERLTANFRSTKECKDIIDKILLLEL